MERKKPGRKAESSSRRGIAWPRWTGFRNKTVWDVLQLLLVPLMLAAIGFWFTAQQEARQQQIEGQRAEQAQKLEGQRAEAERELAEQRAQDEALQAYLDQMSTLLLEKDLRFSTEDNATDASKEARTLARARTLTVLGRLDASRKTQVMQFLVEADLVHEASDESKPIIGLGDADLSYADLNYANLRGADLRGAVLTGTNLSNADLGDAAHWVNAANLEGALLNYANLKGAYLSNANLSDVDLEGAQGLTAEQLAAASSLEGATMPDGQKYDEDWLKSKGSGEDGENTGPS